MKGPQLIIIDDLYEEVSDEKKEKVMKWFSNINLKGDHYEQCDHHEGDAR